MDKIWEYTWRSMEKCYALRVEDFKCPKDFLEEAVCVCIPVVALNYITSMSSCCFKEVKGFCKWEWNETYKTYMPTAYFEHMPLGYNVRNEVNNVATSVFCCKKRKDDLQYLIIRFAETQKQLEDESSKEQLLRDKPSRGTYGDNYFSLYWYCLYLQRLEVTKTAYINIMLKFLFFLYPLYVISVLHQDLKKELISLEKVKFHLEFVRHYFECRDKVKDTLNWAQCVSLIKEYCDIDLNLVQEGYSKARINRGLNDDNTLKSLMKKQLTFFGNVRLRMKDYMSDLISAAQRAGCGEEDINMLRHLIGKCEV